jgi:hypothetical protein
LAKKNRQTFVDGLAVALAFIAFLERTTQTTQKTRPKVWRGRKRSCGNCDALITIKIVTKNVDVSIN